MGNKLKVLELGSGKINLVFESKLNGTNVLMRHMESRGAWLSCTSYSVTGGPHSTWTVGRTWPLSAFSPLSYSKGSDGWLRTVHLGFEALWRKPSSLRSDPQPPGRVQTRREGTVEAEEADENQCQLKTGELALLWWYGCPHTSLLRILWKEYWVKAGWLAKVTSSHRSSQFNGFMASTQFWCLEKQIWLDASSSITHQVFGDNALICG